MAQQAARKQTEIAPRATRAPRLPKVKTGFVGDYSRYRLTFTDADDFLTYMRGYPNPEGVTLFLYRLVPKIDLSLTGRKESNIQKGGYSDLNLYSIESVAEKFGNGQYQVKVTDSNRPDGQKEVVRNCQYKITDAAPPIYDVRTLQLANPDNIDEVNRLIATGVLVRDASGAPRLRNASDAGTVAAAAPVRDGGESFMEKLALAAVQNASQSPRESVKDMIDIAKLITPPPAPAVDVEAIIERVVTRLKPSDPVDVFSQYDKMESFISRFRGPAAGAVDAVNGAASGDSWAPHLAGIFESATSFITSSVAAIREFRQNGNGAAPAAPAQTGAAVQNGQGPNNLPPLEQRIENVFRMGFQEMQKGIPGYDFAAWVCLRMPGGIEVYRALEPHGAQGLLDLVSLNPTAAPLLKDAAVRAQLLAFLADFCSFDPLTDAGSSAPPKAAAASAS